jgi:FkbM family methyltransferase
MTVDAMMSNLQLQRLFLLKIDTEGFDPLVLQGARKSLAEHKVDLLLFEYNAGGVWGTDGFSLKVSTRFYL